MSLLFPLGMAALGALVPLVLLYILRQKRIEHTVPANFLWARALEDLRASSPFQRFRAPLLFLLQAAAITLCALAAAGASLDLDVGDVPRHVILLLDRSASMKTADEDGRPRFEAARELAADLVDGLRSTDEMMIVAFDRRSEVVCAFTPDAQRLGSALATLTPRDLPTRLADALETAVAFARASKGFEPEIVVVSDGCVEDDLPPVPYPVRYARVGTSGANQALTALQVTRLPGEPAQVFVRVDNADTAPVRRTVVLRKGAEVVDARPADVPAGGDVTVWFELPESDGVAAEEWSAALEGRDPLPADDVVPFVVRPVVARTGLVVRREPTVHLDADRVAQLRPGLALAGVSPEEAASALAAAAAGSGPRVDLVIFDGEAPESLPDTAAQIYVDCLPPGSGLTSAGAMQDPVIIDWDRTHPATARCQFDDVIVLEARRLLGHERSRPLVESTGGPLVLLTPVPGREVLVVAFDPARSNLPLKLAWPLFLANAMDHLLATADRAGDDAVRPTGAPWALGGAEVAVTSPSGVRADVTADPVGLHTFLSTYDAGIYRASRASGAGELSAHALLDPAEARIAPRETLVVGGESRASDPSGLRRNLLLRDPLLYAVLGLLLLEWAVWCGRR